ncbi:DUF397 domain-containing protein [Kitasatospora aureofaciens]|uniref:DUF397 domain-containing protein n=1 Tax=Kitasatospora aureofaciens TaxID=1894 RepID=A0A1E7N9X7_KITAU|nr:DUF397 domain-containing protein [Kitasatospora aureofaciens]QEV00282.1 DUF397 domain-containing protein [Streptomyces viridifaciens]ARF79079.1 DUF397 domain-containing protein [Kitasatospora aureofaciens]OEV37495.1 DUF397 domain-containing protein [Kitasatospora aureofaciens]UKZ06495.1 DUF397 domain-containing protein [Streptomyces viridifaciens]GGU82939.1 hypothetical protein GCM10010502_38740 [Kitasatospora aureofaciens]
MERTEQLDWQRSSFSTDQANWLEIASEGEFVYIRESDNPELVVTTTRTKLNAWILGAKDGEFDHFVGL